MWEDWNLRRCFTQKSSLFNCSLSTFQGEVSCEPDLAWAWCWQRGPACDCSPGKPLLAKGVGRRISDIRGAAAASEWAAAFRDHRWFHLGQLRLPSPFPALLPWAPGSQPQSSTLQLAVRLGKLRTPVLRDSRSADLYDNKSKCSPRGTDSSAGHAECMLLSMGDG